MAKMILGHHGIEKMAERLNMGIHISIKNYPIFWNRIRRNSKVISKYSELHKMLLEEDIKKGYVKKGQEGNVYYRVDTTGAIHKFILDHLSNTHKHITTIPFKERHLELSKKERTFITGLEKITDFIYP